MRPTLFWDMGRPSPRARVGVRSTCSTTAGFSIPTDVIVRAHIHKDTHTQAKKKKKKKENNFTWSALCWNNDTWPECISLHISFLTFWHLPLFPNLYLPIIESSTLVSFLLIDFKDVFSHWIHYRVFLYFPPTETLKMQHLSYAGEYVCSVRHWKWKCFQKQIKCRLAIILHQSLIAKEKYSSSRKKNNSWENTYVCPRPPKKIILLALI